MQLRSSAPSPFGRKVEIAARLLGLKDSFTVARANTLDPADSLRQQNPLGKIPCLILDDGEAIFDSRVIVEYLDLIAPGPKLLPLDPRARIAELTGQAQADGVMDAALLIVMEGMRAPGERSERWLDHQGGKIERALAAFAARPPSLAPVGIGAIALGCALDYLTFRNVFDWAGRYPALIAWRAALHEAVPFFAETAPA